MEYLAGTLIQFVYLVYKSMNSVCGDFFLSSSSCSCSSTSCPDFVLRLDYSDIHRYTLRMQIHATILAQLCHSKLVRLPATSAKLLFSAAGVRFFASITPEGYHVTGYKPRGFAGLYCWVRGRTTSSRTQHKLVSADTCAKRFSCLERGVVC